MLESVRSALARYHAEMQKADSAKTTAMDALAEQYSVKGKKGNRFVPQNVKATEAYSDAYRSILQEYEDTARRLTTEYQSKAERALAKVKADVIVKLQKAPSDEVLNSIEAIKSLDKDNITGVEIAMLMEQSRNYLACKALAQISEKTDEPIFIVTMGEILEGLKQCENVVSDFFRYYNPLSYRTMALLQSENSFLMLFDAALEKVIAGNFIKNNNSDFEMFYEISARRKAANDRQALIDEKVAEDTESKYANMTEAEKLALYLKN